MSTDWANVILIAAATQNLSSRYINEPVHIGAADRPKRVEQIKGGGIHSSSDTDYPRNPRNP